MGGAESGRCQGAAHDALPTVLALHGAGGGAWEWACWARAWSAMGGHFVAADFSRAAADPGARMEKLLALLHLRHIAEKGSVLIGASFGGLVACGLARPLRARALVLLNPLPPAPFQSLRLERIDAASASPLRRWGLDARLAGTQASLPELRAGEALLAFRRWVDFARPLLVEAQSGFHVEPPDCPVLVVQSEGDDVIDRLAVEAMVAQWRASHLRLPGSHVSPLLGSGWWEAFDGVRAWLAALN